MDPRFPKALRRGDRVAVVSPAGPVKSKEGLDAGLTRLRQWGLEPVLMPAVLAQDGYLAGDDAARAGDLQRAFDDPQFRAVFATRGGYGCTRILERLRWNRLRADPRPLVGFSDLTALLAAAWREIGLVGFHGPMVAHGPELAMGDRCEHAQRRLLFETKAGTPLPDDAAAVPHVLRAGCAEGRLLGGNLSLVIALLGTRWELDTSGAIVFLEDVGEDPYRVDRMLTQLLHTGHLTRAAGLVLGDFHVEGEPLASEHAEVVRVLHDRLERLAIPVAYGFPFGHRPRSWTLPVGVRARLDASDPGKRAVLELLEPAVR